MIQPIYIIVITLGGAFLLPLFGKSARRTANTVFLAALALIALISGEWLYRFLFVDGTPLQIFTAGIKPPLSINLLMGKEEAFFLFPIHILAFLGGLYALSHLDDMGIKSKALFLTFVLGLSGLVMTRDIFNLFIFLEITSISSYALIGMDTHLKSLSAGFKYAIIGSISSTFLLLGIIFLYSISSTLNLDGMISALSGVAMTPLLSVATFLVFFTFFIEMKQFPINGWALDVYEGTNPGVTAMIAAGSTGAIFFAVYKLIPLFGSNWVMTLAISGLVTFVASNLIGLKQRTATRLLGYSSISQMGLLVSILAIGNMIHMGKQTFYFIIGALFFNHFIAKAALYWLAGIVGRDSIYDWKVLKNRTWHKILFGLLLLALAGFPPFPGFWGKWSLIMSLADAKMFVWIAFILLGSLLEVVYLMRWFGIAVKGDTTADESEGAIFETDGSAEEQALKASTAATEIPAWSFALASIAVGYIFSMKLTGPLPAFIPLIAAAITFALDWLPAKAKGIIALAMIAGYAYRVIPAAEGLALFFNALFLGGGFVIIIGMLHRKARSTGLFPLTVLMIGSMSLLASSQSLLVFFFAWELMTVSSYLLIIRGKLSRNAALIYLVFSQAGAFSMLAGFAVAHSAAASSAATSSWALSSLSHAGIYSSIVFILVSIGFLIKTASIGLHIWAPGAYAESEDDVSPLISAVLSKAGIFGFLVLFLYIGIHNPPHIGKIDLAAVIGWIGVLTALFATLFAVFQEDAKKLLAYSSVGQVGYIVLAAAMMSHLGWVAALWHSVLHLLFKGLLFLAIAGVIYRTGTRNMYQMGGLIKRMPFSFVSVLIGIIALSGVPPLAGFGSKWLVYEALIEKGWYLQTAVAFFASTIAFLYCYRLIHTIFLGQPKPRYKNIKEAPAWLLIPQYILILVIFFLSSFPLNLLKRLSAIVSPIIPATLSWKGFTAFSSLGYWNGTAVMIIVMAIFIIMLLYLLLFTAKPQKVKPFNIVYAAERPESPEVTHYAYNFFSPYRRAMAPILKPLVKRFWGAVSEWSYSTAGSLRHIYTGDGQTYALYIFIVGVLLYFISAGGN